jgi:hypothetical protein
VGHEVESKVVPKRERAWLVAVGIASGLIGVWLASALPRATGVTNEAGATAVSVDTAAVTLVGLGIGIFLAGAAGVVVAGALPPVRAAIESAATAFVAVVVPAMFIANLDTDRLSRIFDVPFVAVAVAPFAGLGLLVGLAVANIRRKATA